MYTANIGRCHNFPQERLPFTSVQTYSQISGSSAEVGANSFEKHHFGCHDIALMQIAKHDYARIGLKISCTADYVLSRHCNWPYE